MHVSIHKKRRAGIVLCARYALCATLGAVFLTACSKTTIDPSRYGQTSGQYAQPAAPVEGQPMPLQESTLSEAPVGQPAYHAAGQTPAGAAPIVAAPAATDSHADPYAAPYAATPATTAAPQAQPYYDPYAAPAAAPARAGHNGPFAPSAEEELAALRAASQAPQAQQPMSAPAPAAAHAGGGTVYQLQAFLDRNRAQTYRDQLAAKGHDVFFESAVVNGQQYTRVLIRLHGNEQERRAVLNSLGAPEARPRRDAPAAPGVTSQAPAQPAPQPAPLAKPAAVPLAAAPGTIPVVTPPAQPAAPPVPQPAPVQASRPADASSCQVTAAHIQATGIGLPGAGSPLMIEKQAREDATRNLLLCVDAYRKERGQIPQQYTMQADIPPGLLQVGDVDLLADGSVRAVMRIRIADLPQLDVQILD